MPLKKAIIKKTKRILRIFTFFRGFLLLTFLGAFLKADINEFEISVAGAAQEILQSLDEFFDTHIDI
jgi:hypothetical protein